MFPTDIYTGWVAQTLGTDLLVESWMHQEHQLPSNCSLPHHVMNIRRVCLPGPQMFSSYEDHSKWCVSYAFKDQWTCLGDLNRDSGQTGRGGGLICSQNPIIYKAFRQAMAGYKHCWDIFIRLNQLKTSLCCTSVEFELKSWCPYKGC